MSLVVPDDTLTLDPDPGLHQVVPYIYSLIPSMGDQMTASFSGSPSPALLASMMGGPFLLPLS